MFGSVRRDPVAVADAEPAQPGGGPPDLVA
jgi:hypothetical protein